MLNVECIVCSVIDNHFSSLFHSVPIKIIISWSFKTIYKSSKLLQSLSDIITEIMQCMDTIIIQYYPLQCYYNIACIITSHMTHIQILLVIRWLCFCSLNFDMHAMPCLPLHQLVSIQVLILINRFIFRNSIMEMLNSSDIITWTARLLLLQ